MSRPALEVADILRSYGPAYLQTQGHLLSSAQRKVLKDLSACRTAVLGGHVEQCDQCGHQRICYDSCRNRHCPKCQAGARAQWLQQQACDLLPTSYFHVVFTLPQQIAPLALQNQRLIYSLLFQAASESLIKIAAEPKHLGAAIGLLAVLHTWGQNLHYHPHLHCVVPGGGLSPDGSRWIPSRKKFLVPVKVLSRLFRRKFVTYVRKAFRQAKLCFHGQLKPLAQAQSFATWLKALAKKDWVVYAKPPCGGPQQVLKYLARYTHRVAISNQRLIALRDGQVTFRWKDYSQPYAAREMTLTAQEFIRRFLLHVLPAGFVRIRHYGWLSNRSRKRKIALCRKLLIGHATPAETCPTDPGRSAADTSPLPSADPCPVCQKGRMLLLEKLGPRWGESPLGLPPVALFNTS
jgi:hypothetical protein